ncbi:transglycosylase domain-containing protein [Sporolactobacillus kofuensis]|uniref:Transglycosylase domain-containing protein n=1 Tax=Sporolactobacillus kofuensis TaxID=269672 RepID=A0ABW1WB26_9BACL|nr:transglycosylase domain-containing protein [Sporolactobacillus kofuensis]MCO7175915.1 penicillin-binding protein [Sporolactobacillus kofuensis]
MRAPLKSFSDFFDRLAEKWASSSVIQTVQSITGFIWNSLLLTICIIVIGLCFAAGTVSGYFAALVHNQPVLSYKTLKHDINNYSQSSVSYFAGNIPIGNMNSDLVRTKTQLKDISPYLTHAVVATEDELFYQHHGVVPKAVIRASMEELLNKPQVTGGSSITQQLVKNQILTNEVSLDRKFKEIMLALRVERFFTKNQILESYLNMASFGRDASGKNIAGAAAAAEGIFGVKADKLSLAQAAFIAGLPKNPFTYSPFQNHGGLKEDMSPGVNRAHTVLRRMYAAGYINKTQLNTALNYDYKKHFAKPEKTINSDYPYLLKEVQDRTTIIFAEIMAQKQGYSSDKLYTDYINYQKMVYEHNNNVYAGKTLQEIAKIHDFDFASVQKHDVLFTEFMRDASIDLANGGYRIYTTINKPIYDDMETFAQNYSGYSPDQYARTTNGQIQEIKDSKTGKMEKVKDPMQVGSILIQNKTGRIISFVGGRGFGSSQLNYATEVPRQNGSTMKPLLVYAPAMELGLIQPGSIVPDLPYKRTVNGKIYAPTDYGSTSSSKLYHGFETARAALAASHNVPAVSVFTRLSNVTNHAPDYLKKMGITSLVGTDGHNVSAALGGITRGITIEENTNAYTTFANNGNFVDAYMIDKITDSTGKIIYQHKIKPVPVFSKQTNYLMLDMMRDVFKYGTGAALPHLLQFSADWSGKTGTSQDWRDSWLVASNPNITMGVWNGYAHNQQLNKNIYSTQTKQLWAGFANRAYDVDPDLMAPKARFKQPKGVEKTTYCGLTDGKATPYCKAAGFEENDLINKKYLPKASIEVLEPLNGQPDTGTQAVNEQNPSTDNQANPNQAKNEKTTDYSLFRIKPDFLKSRFPYTDLHSANQKLLGRIRP